METGHTETVVDKAVNFVKDVFGIPHDAAKEPDDHDTEPEVTAEQAISLDPNALLVSPSGQIIPAISPTTASEPEAERLRRKVDEYPPEKAATELYAEGKRPEDGEYGVMALQEHANGAPNSTTEKHRESTVGEAPLDPEDAVLIGGVERKKSMERKPDRLKARLNDLVGLPPGDGTPHGKGAKSEPDTTPEGGLTSPEAERSNPHSGTGFQVER